jgi:hypothetical protein
MTSSGAKVTVLTWIKNEEHIIPFFLRHYSFADRIIVWDNGSSDMSREMLEANPKVEVHDWDTNGELRDDELLRMKNDEYRKTGEGWNFIVDVDEFVWHPNILGFLKSCDDRGITMPGTVGYDMVSICLPVDDGHSILPDVVRQGRRNPAYDKCCVVRDNCHIAYKPGAHSASAVGGRIVGTDKPYLKLLHYRYLSKELVMEKARRINLSEYNRRCQVGIPQADPKMMAFRWDEAWRERVDVFAGERQG